MLHPKSSYTATYKAFRWDIPDRYNLGVDVCDRLAASDPHGLAIIDAPEGGVARTITFGALRERSNRLAHLLAADIGGGDRVAVLLPQREETALAHIAAWKIGAISIPLFVQFGPDALAYRLRDAGARVVVTDEAGAAKLQGIASDLPELKRIHVVGPELEEKLAGLSTEFDPVDTAADDPALIIYTSGTTGAPKGALHAHRVLLGHLPGVEMSHDFLPQPGDRIWTPADWAWIGGLLDVLLPALHHGVPVVACRFARFTADAAFDLIETHGVRNAFLPPTALRMMRQAGTGRAVPMRSVASGGEALGADLLAWGRETFGVTINEFYGQTECNMVVSSCAALAKPEPGAMGWPVPGHRVAVIDPTSGERVAGEGEIAVAAPDPVMMLGYWNKPDATAAKYVADPSGTRWLLTGDRGQGAAGGRLRFIGRDDDVISSAGYRIGPGEIEDCLTSHPAVSAAGVIGLPDPVRGQRVVAAIVLSDGQRWSAALEEELSMHVRQRLAPYETPRAFHILDQLPVTTTGKIRRGALRENLSRSPLQSD